MSSSSNDLKVLIDSTVKPEQLVAFMNGLPLPERSLKHRWFVAKPFETSVIELSSALSQEITFNEGIEKLYFLLCELQAPNWVEVLKAGLFKIDGQALFSKLLSHTTSKTQDAALFLISALFTKTTESTQLALNRIGGQFLDELTQIILTSCEENSLQKARVKAISEYLRCGGQGWRLHHHYESGHLSTDPWAYSGLTTLELKRIDNIFNYKFSPESNESSYRKKRVFFDTPESSDKDHTKKPKKAKSTEVAPVDELNKRLKNATVLG